MNLRYKDEGLEITWEGAEVGAVYRAYLAEIGRRDGATKDALAATVNRQPLVEWLDEDAAGVVAEALEAAGMLRTANTIRSHALSMEADRMRWDADDLEWEANRVA